MAGGAESTSSAKRAKLRKKKKRDALERKKNDLFLRIEKAKEYLAQQLPIVCADLEAENHDELMEQLPLELWEKIVDEYVQQNDLLALAMTCRFFREKQKDLGKKVETDLNYGSLLRLQKSGRMPSHSLGWFQWVCDTFEILPGFEDYKRVKGAVYEGDLVNYAAFQGSVEILRWLMEEKGWELNEHTGKWVGLGGSIEVLEYLLKRGYDFGRGVCRGSAQGGHLEALKFLRGLDPPCPWDGWTCNFAAEEGHLEVLKWLRSQDPPCPWDERTCAEAAKGGHLDVLKWARAQDPPCSWRRSACRESASQNYHQHIVKWIDQQEDESDAEFSDSDRSYDSYGDEYW